MVKEFPQTIEKFLAKGVGKIYVFNGVRMHLMLLEWEIWFYIICKEEIKELSPNNIE